MILLNACSTRKIEFNDSESCLFFSVIPNPPKDFEMHHFGDIIVDAATAEFLRDFEIEWLRSEDKSQVLAVRVEAEKSVCRKFLESFLEAQLSIDAKVLLDDE